MSTLTFKSKGLNKTCSVAVTVLDLEEQHGDKYAAFLFEVQNSVQEKYLVQYGINYRSLVFYDRDSPAAIFQVILGTKFLKWAKSQDKAHFSTRFLMPKNMFWTKATGRRLSITCLNVEPVAIANNYVELSEILWDLGSTKEMHLIKPVGHTFEVYKYAKWEVVGVKFSSQKEMKCTNI